MQDRTYSDLLFLIQSLVGGGNLTTEEQGSIDSFINRRAHEAFQTSQTWPRFLVGSEERTITTANLIPYAQGGKNNIGEFLKIYRKQAFLNDSSIEYDFFVDSNGANILNITNTTDSSAFVTYKKELPQYTITSTDIPGEWFFFIAHGAYADFLRMEGRVEQSMAEEGVAQGYLAQELEKVDNMSNNNVFRRFSTHGTRQSR